MSDCDCESKFTAPERLPGTGATGTTTLPADRAAQVRGANNKRRSLTVVNETGGAIRVGYDENQVGPLAGILVAAGQNFQMDNIGACWAYSATGGRVSYAEEIDA